MSQTTTLILLPQTAHNGTATGEARPAAAYYLGNRDLQTINWNVAYVTCTLTIQATLATSPLETDWFKVFEVSYDNESAISFTNLLGNFVWIRAVVTNFSLGTIQYIKLSY